MRTRRLVKASTLLLGLAVGLLATAPAFAGGATVVDTVGYSAFSMRPFSRQVEGTDLGSWRFPFLSKSWTEADILPGNGSGASFTYTTYFVPKPIQRDLYQRPVSVIAPPEIKGNYRMSGMVYVRDNTGSRVIEYASLFDGVQRPVYNLFADGTKLFHQDGATDATLIRLPYAGARPAGVEEFLVGLKLQGAVRGDAMSKLLAKCGARQMPAEQGASLAPRELVYCIAANDYDQSHGYNYLKVTVRVGDFKIIRTELEYPWGTERTDYDAVRDGLKFNDAMFSTGDMPAK